MAIVLRRATKADADTIIEFNRRLAEESEGKVLPRELLEPGVVAGLADANKTVYFLAEVGGRAAGEIMYTREWSDWRNGWFWWVQGVYVVPEYRRQGVLRTMYSFLRDLARRDPEVIGLRLYVEADNRRAQEAYQKLGMKLTGYFVMEEYPLA